MSVTLQANNLLDVQELYKNDSALQAQDRGLLDLLQIVDKTFEFRTIQQLMKNACTLKRAAIHADVAEFRLRITRFHLMMYYMSIYMWIAGSVSPIIDGLVSAVRSGEVIDDGRG